MEVVTGEDREAVQNLGMRSLKINVGFLEPKCKPQVQNAEAAWEVHIELFTRIASQPLPLNAGVESAALDSVYSPLDPTQRVLAEGLQGLCKLCADRGHHPEIRSTRHSRPAGTGSRMKARSLIRDIGMYSLLICQICKGNGATTWKCCPRSPGWRISRQDESPCLTLYQAAKKPGQNSKPNSATDLDAANRNRLGRCPVHSLELCLVGLQRIRLRGRESGPKPAPDDLPTDCLEPWARCSHSVLPEKTETEKKE